MQHLEKTLVSAQRGSRSAVTLSDDPRFSQPLAPECGRYPYPPSDVVDSRFGRTAPQQLHTRADPLVLILPRRSMKGWPDATTGLGRYVTLEHLLTAPFETDVHFSQYTAFNHPLRLLHWAYEQLPSPPHMWGIVFDVDNKEAHSSRLPASDSWFAAEYRKLEGLQTDIPGACVYRTTHGYRIVYRLDHLTVIATEKDEYDWRLSYVRSCVHLARDYDIITDPTCKSWAWLFRAPRATRNRSIGPEAREFIGDPKNVGPWTYVPR